MKSNASWMALDVARWMLAELDREGMLSQEEAVSEIGDRFGEEFTPPNENGNLSIRTDVLAAFRKLTDETVVWERGERLWRKRERHDNPGRQQN